MVVQGRGNLAGCTLDVSATGHNRVVGTLTGHVGDKLRLAIQEVHPWSPDDPFLYDLTVALKRNGEIVDVVHSYFAMRKIAVEHDAAGHDRIALNGKPLFNIGVLDAGYWPDGLYTAPSDEALRFDIEAAKRMGFNTIRKDNKGEPERWYYHCDRLGMLVWQDTVPRTMWPGKEDAPAAHRQYEEEMQAMVAELFNHPSIVIWVVAGDDWSGYDRSGLNRWIKHRDSTRLLDAEDAEHGDVVESYGHFYGTMKRPVGGKVIVINGTGGAAVPIGGHEWRPEGVPVRGGLRYGEVCMFYQDLMNRLKPMVSVGLCAAIYRQSYDVEREQNGLMSYDREIFKVLAERLAQVNRGLVRTPSARLVRVIPPGQSWSYSRQRPPENWTAVALDDSRWPSGTAPFGTVRGLATDIWLRRTIALEKPLKMPALEIFSSRATMRKCMSMAGWPRPSLSSTAITPSRPFTPKRPRADAGQAHAGRALPARLGRPGHRRRPCRPENDRPRTCPATAPRRGGRGRRRPHGPRREMAGARHEPAPAAGRRYLGAGQPGPARRRPVGRRSCSSMARIWPSGRHSKRGIAGPAKWKVENGYMEVRAPGRQHL